MKALITGHMGNLGCEFETALKSRGYDVTGLDLSDRPMVNAERFFMDDRRQWDLVVHCAQGLGYNPYNERYNSFVARNAMLDAALWSWVNRTGQRNIIYPSSSEVYGESFMHARESDTLNPTTVIGKIKAHGEMLGGLLRSDENQFLFPRYFEVFSRKGFSTSIDVGRTDVIKELRWSKDAKIDLNGDDVIDVLYVVDAVNITLDLFEAGRRGPVNVSSGVGIKRSDFANLVLETMARPGSTVTFNPLVDSVSRVGYNGVMLRYSQPQYTLEGALKDAHGRI